MRLLEKVKRLEKTIGKNDAPPGIAIQYLNGQISWNGQIFLDEPTFTAAVDKTFKDRPPSSGPNVIIVRYYREMPVAAQTK